jgi:hypothetical protein
MRRHWPYVQRLPTTSGKGNMYISGLRLTYLGTMAITKILLQQGDPKISHTYICTYTLEEMGSILQVYVKTNFYLIGPNQNLAFAKW